MPRSGAPLAGYRVLEFTHVWAGPLCGQILADLGAEVIRLESRRRLDIHRMGGPYPENRPGINRSGVWNSQNRGKLSCTLNLATAEGRDLARRLVGLCDGVIENFSPGTLERLGLGFDVLRAVRSDLVMVSLSAYGQSGPHRSFVGYGPMMDAACGIMAAADYGDGVPRAVNGWAADVGGALFGAVELLVGLLTRSPGGARWSDVSEYEAAVLFQFEALLAWAACGEEARPSGNLAPCGGLTECFACAGHDRWVAVSATTPAHLRTLAALTGATPPTSPGSAGLPPAELYGGLIDAVGRWTGTRERSEVIRSLQSLGVPCAPVNDVADLLEDPMLMARKAFMATEHPEIGTARSYGPVWDFLGRSIGSPRPAPCLGGDNQYVFGELLGLDGATIADLEHRQVIY